MRYYLLLLNYFWTFVKLFKDFVWLVKVEYNLKSDKSVWIVLTVAARSVSWTIISFSKEEALRRSRLSLFF